MAALTSNGNPSHGEEHPPITKITVGGFKSIRDEQSIELAPLTILAGANSSGKSSMMQPLLLLKQTLESPHDPGPWLLPGTHFRFDSARDILWHCDPDPDRGAQQFHVGIRMGSGSSITSYFEFRESLGLFTARTIIDDGTNSSEFTPNMPDPEIRRQVPSSIREHKEAVARSDSADKKLRWEVPIARCFLQPTIEYSAIPRGRMEVAHGTLLVLLDPVLEARPSLLNLIHLPGIRRNPADSYARSGLGPSYPGTFDPYVASVIEHWQRQENSPVLADVKKDLQLLDLTSDVWVDQIGDAALRLLVVRVSRPSREEEWDFVPMGQTGLGTSHALPVVVALHAATANNLVYLEQPELHLHPRAQVAMAEVLARAVKRGVRMVIETHSALLLLAVQALVAEGNLSPDDVKLHWFTRSAENGETKIATAKLDEAGAYGDWPEDFGDVESKLDCRYLDAAESRMSKR